ncbi:MAG: TIGR02391 family protein [Methanolobus sp.]
MVANKNSKENREKLNNILIFSGFEYGEDGNFRKCKNAHTLTEAEKRLRTIQSKFEERKIHPEVVKYCRAELLQDNYFHAVFEATKGLAQRIRDMSGIELDGAALVDKVFSIENQS